MKESIDKWYNSLTKQHIEANKTKRQVEKDVKDMEKRVNERNEILRLQKNKLQDLKEKNLELKNSKPTPEQINAQRNEESKILLILAIVKSLGEFISQDLLQKL